MSQHKPALDLRVQPGHAIRRLHQAAVALFMQEVGELGLTPVQYSSLQTICDQPGLDQKTLAQAVSFDTSTIGSVLDRLEARGLIERRISPQDRRVRLLTPTAAGKALLKAVVPRMLKAQDRILQPLSAEDAQEFMRLTQILINANEPSATCSADESAALPTRSRR